MSEFYKLIPPDFTSYGYTFCPGWNRDYDGRLGFHFSTLQHVFDGALENDVDVMRFWLVRVFVDDTHDVEQVRRCHYRSRFIFLSCWRLVQDCRDDVRVVAAYPPLVALQTNDQFVMEVLRQNGGALRFLRDGDKSYDRCMAATRNDMNALDAVPQRHMTNELVLPLLAMNPALLRHVHSPTREMSDCSLVEEISEF